MGWIALWLLVGAIGAWLRWAFADPLVVRLLENSAEAGGGPAAFESIHQLGRFVEGAGLVVIAIAAFMLTVQFRRMRKDSESR